jgi:hypothetical protein
LTGYWPAPSTPSMFNSGSNGGDSTGASGQPGIGASGDTVGVYNMVMPGGRGGWSDPRTGLVTIWEFY